MIVMDLWEIIIECVHGHGIKLPSNDINNKK